MQTRWLSAVSGHSKRSSIGRQARTTAAATTTTTTTWQESSRQRGDADGTRAFGTARGRGSGREGRRRRRDRGGWLVQTSHDEDRWSSWSAHRPWALRQPFSTTTLRLASAPKNPYDVLGVDKSAKASEIKKKYYELARKYHPDANKEANAKERFVDIQTAYDTLSDETKRAQFDRYGTTSDAGFDPAAGGGFGRNPFTGAGGRTSSSGGFASGGIDPNDIFENLFGGAFAGARPGGGFAGGPFAGAGAGSGMDSRGDDIEVGLTIDFMEAAKGGSRTISIQPITTCSTCSGHGLKKGSSRQTCQACGGTGSRTFMIQSGFQMASTCQVCNGQGSTIPRDGACGDCDGFGKVKQNKSVKVDIPAGIDDGARIRLDRQGDAPLGSTGKTGRPGDLYVRLSVRPHPTLRRSGQNISTEVTIPFYSAILGGSVKVTTLDGPVQVKVPAGTQVGDRVKMSGRGVPRMFNSTRGDLFVTFNVSLPRSLSQEQKEIIERYQAQVLGTSKSDGRVKTARDEPNVRQAADAGASLESNKASRADTTNYTESPSGPAEDSGAHASSSSSGSAGGGGGFFRKAIHNLFHPDDAKTPRSESSESASPAQERSKG